MEKLNQEYPKTIRVGYFKQDDDIRDAFKEWFVTEEIVYTPQEESDFYCSISPNANVKITIS